MTKNRFYCSRQGMPTRSQAHPQSATIFASCKRLPTERNLVSPRLRSEEAWPNAPVNVHTMRQSLECCHRGWGESVTIGVTPSGTEISGRRFQLVTGWDLTASAFGSARDVPKIVDWSVEGKINIDDLITLTTPPDKISDTFELLLGDKVVC